MCIFTTRKSRLNVLGGAWKRIPVPDTRDMNALEKSRCTNQHLFTYLDLLFMRHLDRFQCIDLEPYHFFVKKHSGVPRCMTPVQSKEWYFSPKYFQHKWPTHSRFIHADVSIRYVASLEELVFPFISLLFRDLFTQSYGVNIIEHHIDIRLNPQPGWSILVWATPLHTQNVETPRDQNSALKTLRSRIRRLRWIWRLVWITAGFDASLLNVFSMYSRVVKVNVRLHWITLSVSFDCLMFRASSMIAVGCRLLLFS